jgi:hypothetical protein
MMFSKSSTTLLLCGYLFLGIAHIAFLPPWEGFDENAHFSYIQQLADTGSLPKRGSAKLSQDVEDYMQYAPMPYCYVPFFKKGEVFTYHTYFNAPTTVIQTGYANIHLPPEKPRRYRPGQRSNWQAQHPPLYYALLSPLFQITRGLALIDQLFWLRLVSYLMAWSALVISVFGGYRLSAPQGGSQPFALNTWMVIGTVSIPLFFPSWYPEMARIGNDSLCALLLAILWLLFMRIQTVGKTCRHLLLLGLILGLGCLTKAFFVPLSAGILFSLLLHEALRDGGSKKTAFLNALVTLLALVVVSGWWFIGNWLEGGSPLGSMEVNLVKASGGLIDNLRQHFSLYAWLRGHAAMIATLGWSCTWSFLRPPYITMLPLAALVIFLTFGYLAALPRFKVYTLAWSPFWCALPVIMGLSYHVLLRMALNVGGSGTSGYYLLFMVPIFGLSIGLALGSFWPKKLFRLATALFGLYALVFAVVISWVQVLMFAGIISASNDNKFYRLPEQFPPYFGITDALTNLATLVHPTIGALFWLAGGTALIIGLALGWRSIRLCEST